jgi:aryl-alcohol dehydrogenase-like predicted oxidoreductase
MQYRRLGVSGLKGSPLCLGAMMFGGTTDEATAARIVARAHEQGVNFIDTADGNNGGRSEEIVGRAIRAHRSWWVLATRCFSPTGAGPNARGKGMTPGQFAFAWVLNNRFITAAIGGPRTEQQSDDYAGPLSRRFDKDDEAFIDRLASPGHPPTPGYSDSSDPLEGRVPRCL